jgi:glycosyltransferase involved in cell wall biosynthesis
MNSPFISICIPTYKRTDLLKILLDSIIIQSFQDYEILINDNSPDDSVKKLVGSYASRLKISYEKNEPAVSAVENGIKVMRRASAPWIKVMHDDDWFSSEDALQQFADAAVHSGKDFIFCASNQVYLETNKKEVESLTAERKKMLDDSFFSLFYLNVIGHPSVVMHKRDMAIEYDKQFNWVLDIDYYLRYLNAHGGYHYISKPLVNIGKSSTQESYRYYKNPAVEIPEYFSLLNKYDSDLLLKNQYVFHLVWNMLKRFKIKHIEDIRATGFKGQLPDKVQAIINYQKKIPRIILKQPSWSERLMKSCYKRLTQQGPAGYRLKR